MQKQKSTIRKMFKEIIVLMILTVSALGIFGMFTVVDFPGEQNFLQVSVVYAAGEEGAVSNTKTDGTNKGVPTTENTTVYIPLAGEENYDGLKTLDASQGPVSMLNQFVQGGFKNLKYILGAIAVLFIVLAALKLIIKGDNEESVETQKMAIFFGIVGLVVIGFASEIVKVFYVACPPGAVDCTQGGFLASPSAMIQQSAIFSRVVQIAITFIKYFVGGLALVMLARNGIRLVALAGEEEGMELDKKNVIYTSLGLVLILMASTAIDKVLFVVDKSRYPTTGGVTPALDVSRGLQEIVGVTNYAVSFAAPVAILVLIIGAIMYATAAGNEETMNRAKRLIMFAIVGMIFIYGAFAIVSTVISGQFSA
ncbi:pilin [Patescibacteria group bacterium]|nr:pilin [Patescibacteria group bacterium]